MDALDAIEHVRQCRRGAFNSLQVGFLARYKRTRRSPFRDRMRRLLRFLEPR
jgi:hypothetical protein